MPYWLSLLSDVQRRGGDLDAARATLDAAIVEAQTHEDVWWLPECCGSGSFEPVESARLERLRAAVALASEQGSTALIERCLA